MGRKAKPKEKKIRTLGASVVKPFEDSIIELGLQRERNKAWFSGRLLLRGYIAFLADGQFEADDVKDEAIHKGLRPEQLVIIEAQLKINGAKQDIPIPSKPFIPMPPSGEITASKKEKGGRK